MSSPELSARSFYRSLMDISLGIVWKDPFYAIAYEPENNRIDAETYISAKNGLLNFKAVFHFHDQVLAPFFQDPQMLNTVTLHKRMIPESMRDDIVAAEAKYMIDYWENRDGEQNNYYRMLFGLPPIGASPDDYVYNTKYDDVTQTVPLHLLNHTQRLKLENKGYFDELLKDPNHADKKYLYHLGKRKISPHIARQAEYFQLLYVPASQYENLRSDFMDVYEQARRMVLRVYYNDAYRNQSHLYEGFLGMLILFITQQRMCVKYLEADIPRNFYDLESLKLVYDAYGVPFYSNIPLKYHERIVKRLNELISYKGSTRVFYDIFSLFDFGTMDVFEYYLVKERLTGDYGNPIFRDSEGNPLKESQKFNRRFARVNWKDNTFIQITDKEKKIPYTHLTEPDPYWIEDSQLQDKMYETDWNYFHSKYMGVQIMFELSKLMFETCYFLHLLKDNRETLSEATCYYMLTGEDVPIFDMVIYAIAILCRNAGYTGEIPTDPASIAAIYGFNFKEINHLLKMATDPIGDFVIELKRQLKDLADKNEVLKYDTMLRFLIDCITDGAFNYLGNDFPYSTWGHAPYPVFLHDFMPTDNSIENLRRYIRETINALKGDSELTNYEIVQLYRRFVTEDNYKFTVVSVDDDVYTERYSHFIVKSVQFDDDDLAVLRETIIASYEAIYSALVKLINARKALTFDPQLLEMISNMNVDSAEDVDRVYRKLLELDDYLSAKIRESHHKFEYEAYANARKILMTTHEMRATFEKKDGTVATTYEDLLADINPHLYERYTSETFDPDTEEDYVIQTLMKLCDEITLLESINTANIKQIVDYMFNLLRFLKSAKVDLVDFNVIYMITDRTMNYIKLLSMIYEQHINARLPDDYLYFATIIWSTYVRQYLRDELWLWDNYRVDVWFEIDEAFKIVDKVYTVIEQQLVDKFEFLFDDLGKSKVGVALLEPIQLICNGSNFTFIQNPIWQTPDKKHIIDFSKDHMESEPTIWDGAMWDKGLILTNSDYMKRRAEVYDPLTLWTKFLLSDENGTRRSADVVDDSWPRQSRFWLTTGRDIFPFERTDIWWSIIHWHDMIWSIDARCILNGSRFLLTDENAKRLSSEVLDDSWPRQSRFLLTTAFHGHFPVHNDQFIYSDLPLWVHLHFPEVFDDWSFRDHFLFADEDGKRNTIENLDRRWKNQSRFTLLDKNKITHNSTVKDAYLSIMNMHTIKGFFAIKAPEVNDAVALHDSLIKVEEHLIPDSSD